jgi:FixJ family two-component response regulator
VWVGIVDDDESIRRALVRIFLFHDIASRAFASAEEYLHRSPAEEPCCLLVDVHLGGMSGFELQAHLEAEGKTTPIVFITAVERISSEQLEGRSGRHGYLRKPFETSALLELVRAHARGSTETATP